MLCRARWPRSASPRRKHWMALRFYSSRLLLDYDGAPHPAGGSAVDVAVEGIAACRRELALIGARRRSLKASRLPCSDSQRGARLGESDIVAGGRSVAPGDRGIDIDRPARRIERPRCHADSIGRTTTPATTSTPSASS